MFTSPMATVAKRNLTHCLQWFAAWQNSTRHLQTFARMRTGAGSPHQNFTTKKRPQGTVFLLWRPGSESNRHPRICSPLHNHSATRPKQQEHITQKKIVFQDKNSI